MLLILLIIGLICHVIVVKLVDEVFPASEDELLDIRLISFSFILMFFIFYCKVVLP